MPLKNTPFWLKKQSLPWKLTNCKTSWLRAKRKLTAFRPDLILCQRKTNDSKLKERTFFNNQLVPNRRVHPLLPKLPLFAQGKLALNFGKEAQLLIQVWEHIKTQSILQAKQKTWLEKLPQIIRLRCICPKSLRRNRFLEKDQMDLRFRLLMQEFLKLILTQKRLNHRLLSHTNLPFIWEQNPLS